MQIRSLSILVISILLVACTYKILPEKPRELMFEQTYQLTHIGSKHIDSKNAPTIIFKENGKLIGFGGCNKWAGSYQITDFKAGTLKISRPISSLMMCEKKIIEQEITFLQIMPTIIRYQIDKQKRLVLYPGSGKLLAFELTSQIK